MRLGDYAYFGYGDGDRELYDLSVDPYQLDNIYDAADSGLIAELETRFDALADCGEKGSMPCQAVDGGS